MADTGANHTSYRVEMAWAWNEGPLGVNLGDLRRLVEQAADMDDSAPVILEDVSNPNPATPTEYHAERITVRDDYYDEEATDG